MQYRVDGGDWDKVDQSGSFHSGMIKFKVMDLYEGRHTLEVRDLVDIFNVWQL